MVNNKPGEEIDEMLKIINDTSWVEKAVDELILEHQKTLKDLQNEDRGAEVVMGKDGAW